MTLEHHRQKLLDPSGLDVMAKELLDAIGEAIVLVYHLLSRGDDSWLRRDSIISRVKALSPIVQPGSLFRSVIVDADKESLRQLVQRLGDVVKADIREAEYDTAVGVVSQMLQLKWVESDFVTAIVDQTVSEAVDGRMAALKSVIFNMRKEVDGGDVGSGGGGGSTGGDSDDGDDPAEANALLVTDAHNIDEARRELRSMSLMLVAFAGIMEVREQLTAFLVDAACELECAVKQAAEKAGRRRVDEPLREVLREVGDNVVQEVIELPKAAERMKWEQRMEWSDLRRRTLRSCAC